MSADRWSKCPECARKRKLKKAKLVKAAEDSYGKVSKKDFDKLKADADEFNGDVDETFREDYEIGMGIIFEGELYISYRGSCTECGFEKKFNYHEPPRKG